MFNITKIARRGGGAVLALGVSLALAGPAMADTPAPSTGLDPSHYVIAPETPGLKAPAPADQVVAPAAKKAVSKPVAKTAVTKKTVNKKAVAKKAVAKKVVKKTPAKKVVKRTHR